MYRVKLVVITSSFSAKELRQKHSKLGHPVTTIINLFSRLSLNEATFHLCILIVATSEDERFVAPYCRSLHIAQQAKIPGLILAGDMKPQGIAPGWTFDVKICGTICCGNSLCIRDQTKVVP